MSDEKRSRKGSVNMSSPKNEVKRKILHDSNDREISSTSVPVYSRLSDNKGTNNAVDLYDDPDLPDDAPFFGTD
jgi:hypothetical protein